MDFVGEPLVGKGVVERRFDAKCEDRVVPGIVWTPEGATGPRPLVLLGHGASLHKRTEYLVVLARRLVRHHGIAAVSIDGPHHGDRASAPGGDALAWWSAAVTDDMVADWKQVIGDVQALPEVGNGPLGYWGLSMGTIFGLPFVAAEPRIQVAVLGLMGITGPTKERIAADAARLACPVLFVFQWDDELFKREDGMALFDAIGTQDKRMHVNPGAHSAVPPEQFVATEAFLARHLLPQ